MRYYLPSSLILIAICLSFLLIPQANALPVSYNQTALNFGLTSVPRNSSSYDVFTLNQDNWLWEKFDNNTVDSSPLSITSSITYNSNLKALWKFENVLTDSSTNARTLTKAAGTTTYTTSAEEGSGLVLDGSTYYTASDTGLPTGTNPVSVSGWLNFGSFATQPMYFGYGTTGGHTAFYLFITGGGVVAFFDGTTQTNISTTTLSTNTWYYVTVTYDGTNARVYINGVLDKTTAITVNTSLAGATGVTVGAISGGADKMTGKIDELRVYSGTALTLQQHQALYMVGHYSQSHTFDGGEYVSLGNTLGFERTDHFSFSTWYKRPTTSGNTVIIEKGTGLGGASGTGWKIYDDGNIEFELTNTQTTNSIRVRASDVSIDDGNWHYIAFTYSGSSLASGVSYYVDNSPVSLTTISDTLSSSILNNNNLVIGADSSGSFPITAQFDNMKIYPYTLSSSQITSDYNSISPISSGKQFMSYYHGVSGSNTLTNKLGAGQTTTLLCNLNSVAPSTPQIVSNMSNIYYACVSGNAPYPIKKFDIIANTNSHVYTSTQANALGASVLFMGMKHIFSASSDGSGFNYQLNSEKGNVTQGGASGSWTTSNQQINIVNSPNTVIKFNDNSTTIRTSSSNQCNINFNPSNLTKQIDSIACDQAVPAMAIKYWNGMMIQKIGGYSTNTTQTFLNSVDASAYKKLLTLPCALYGAEAPCITFILTDQTQTDYLVVLTSAHVYYGNAQTALAKLQTHNYALQSYDIITTATTSAYEIQNPILQGITLYGFNLNTTLNKAGLFTLPSGSTTKTTTINSAIRTIDPQWTDDSTDIPIITTSSSLFPIFLTASNAPAFAAIKVTSATQIINGQEAVYAVAQLDSTRSVEFDLIAGTCANIYIADISVSPSVWNFQGIICATGVNQKTIAYTNTVPFTFYTLKYGVTDSYVPANNGLQTTFRTNQSPTTYTVLVRNSTGTVAINQTFTVPANQTVDTRTFNVSSVSKPAALSVMVSGNQVYSAYLGSSLSLATMSSFFHQYFSYQGFDLLSFIPVVFASMFTRNTVGVGMALTVVCIATLSWLSIVVVPETAIYASIFIAALAMVGYRSIYG